MPAEFLSANYWDERYRKQQTGWDIGHVSTPLKNYFDQLTDKNIRVLIPGGGNSYEAQYLYGKGFHNITIIDISKVVTEKIRNKFTAADFPGITILAGDFFELTGEYDLIVEQTFFCALDPSLREQYADHVKNLLSDNGKLVGLLFNREFETNPPFGGNIDEYRQLFSKGLRIGLLEICYNSIPERQGSELFLIACKFR